MVGAAICRSRAGIVMIAIHLHFHSLYSMVSGIIHPCLNHKCLFGQVMVFKSIMQKLLNAKFLKKYELTVLYLRNECSQLMDGGWVGVIL